MHHGTVGLLFVTRFNNVAITESGLPPAHCDDFAALDPTPVHSNLSAIKIRAGWDRTPSYSAVRLPILAYAHSVGQMKGPGAALAEGEFDRIRETLTTRELSAQYNPHAFRTESATMEHGRVEGGLNAAGVVGHGAAVVGVTAEEGASVEGVLVERNMLAAGGTADVRLGYDFYAVDGGPATRFSNFCRS
ncbi:hypothetical protein BDK51DRAFT_31905 [Blyttiomyces helicus]|uniref:Uncharacterized protein n=1 Tax=Blyttiomyces helicus TaxID=388810 RepID=A0A4P9VWX8_9FUNG|nr:hypothetical protein BDK51DRAFT_31905 [Blyttiomyces helicus]|eukprot:RKO82770.1 hypothetical protein BDK51DRAFT_31905 [Blyttiomyces helicus]